MQRVPGTDKHLSFGRWLRQLRESNHLSQQELGEAVGYARGLIHVVEHGRRPARQFVLAVGQLLRLGPDLIGELVDWARSGASDSPPPGWALGLRIPTGPDLSAHNLPAPLAPLLGREHEVKLVRQRLLRSSLRLCTLVGPPGVGKSRLALEVATSLVRSFADGVWWIELAPVRDPSLTHAAIAQSLGLRESGSRPPSEVIRDNLRPKRLLLVLDNFEHLLPATRSLNDILSAAPDVKVMVTSRAPLGMYGEHQFVVPPLAVPRAGLQLQATDAQQYAAVQLFVERAQAAHAEFALHDDNASEVVSICHRLDGIPLAIELAAAQLVGLEPRAILDRLEHSLEVLIVNRPFRFGGGLFRAESHAAWADGARRLEAAGYATALIGDHFSATFFAPIPALLAAALATTRLRVGCTVFANDFRHQLPWLRTSPLPMFSAAAVSSSDSARATLSPNTTGLGLGSIRRR